jgi:uroporphyrinogen III methyltransferase/synthase
MMQTANLKPLSGVKVLVTRPLVEAQSLSNQLRALGATAIELPTIEIVPPESYDQMDRAIRSLGSYDWVIFTSVHGVGYFIDRMSALSVPVETLNKVHVAAIGPATASALEQSGKTADFVPSEYLSELIVPGLGDLHGKRVLLPRAGIASKRLPALLRKRGAVVDEVIAYRTVIPRDLTRQRLKSVLSGGVDFAAFTSPSTIRSLATVVSDHELQRSLESVKIACIGPVTADAVKELGLRVEVVARNHTIGALVEAIVNEVRTL